LIKINKDTKVCISLAKQSGNFGTRIYNHVFEMMKMNFVYKSFSTDDLGNSLAGARALGIKGISITMPYKTPAMSFVDEMSEEVQATQSINTIVNENGTLKAYNTDIDSTGIVLRETQDRSHLYILGAGGLSKSVKYSSLGMFENTTVVTRENWEIIGSIKSGVVFNCTPVANLSSEFDNKKTTFIDARVETRTGRRLAVLQAARQFNLYTGENFPVDYVLDNIDQILEG